MKAARVISKALRPRVPVGRPLIKSGVPGTLAFAGVGCLAVAAASREALAEASAPPSSALSDFQKLLAFVGAVLESRNDGEAEALSTAEKSDEAGQQAAGSLAASEPEAATPSPQEPSGPAAGVPVGAKAVAEGSGDSPAASEPERSNDEDAPAAAAAADDAEGEGAGVVAGSPAATTSGLGGDHGLGRTPKVAAPRRPLLRGALCLPVRTGRRERAPASGSQFSCHPHLISSTLWP